MSTPLPDPEPEPKAAPAKTLRISEADVRSKLLMPYSEFGEYTVLTHLGTGGMGIVYGARHRGLNRRVALKVMRSGPLATAEETDRFRREAEAAAKLNHPNIVPIFEIGQHAGCAFFSMQYVEGQTLSEFNFEVPDRGGAWMRSCANIMAKVARAVQHAHEHLVLHRDLKPGNILLDEQGEPHVTDFGLAKLLQSGEQHTLTDTVMGTPEYMSPEQAAGISRDITTAADIFSLGAVMYHLLTGKYAFKGATPLETIGQVLNKTPAPLRKVHPCVPRDLEVICLKCLEKEPAHRYSAAALADELERWLAGRPILARPSSRAERVWKWVRRNPRLAGALGIAVISAVTAAVGITSQWLRAERNYANSQRLNARLEIQRAEDFFTDGNPAAGLGTLARVLRDDPNNRVAAARIVNRLHQGRVLMPISDPMGMGTACAFFTADGHVATAGTNAHGWALTISRPGRFERALSLPHGTNRIRSAAVSRDGRLAATGLEFGAYLWNLEDGTLLREFGRPSAVSFVGFCTVAGGAALLAVTNDVVVVHSVADDTAWPLPGTSGAAIVAAALPPDGARLAVGTEDGALRLYALDATGNWTTISNAHPDAVIRGLAFSQDGRLLVSVGTDRKARLWKTDRGEPSFTLHAEDSILRAEFNATGTLVVTASRDGVAQVWDTRTGLPAAPPLAHPKVNTARFSLDGKWVLTAGDDGVARVWFAESGQLAAATPAATLHLADAMFSPGDRCILTFAADAPARLWTMVGGTGTQPSSLEPGSPLNDLAPSPSVIPSEELAVYRAAHSDIVTFSDATTNGFFAATASRDHTARLWDRRTRRPVSEPLAHDARVNCAQFSADGLTLATSTSNRKIRLWDTRTGQPITDSITSQRPIAKVWLSADGHFVVTAEGEVWSVYAEQGKPPDWLPALAESVAGLRFTANRVSEPVPAAALPLLRQQISSVAAANWLGRWANEVLHEIPAE